MTTGRTKCRFTYFFLLSFIMVFFALPGNTAMGSLPKEHIKRNFCDAVNYKFLQFGWNEIICNQDRWTTFNYSSKGYPLLYQEFGFNDTNNNSPVNLLLCGVHGDEPSSIYICFHLVREILFDNPQEFEDLRLVIAPIVNPEGFFANTRHNANGVDPNRNLPTRDWDQLAQKVWIEYKKDPRKYPGAKAGSEPESRLQTYLVNKYRPDKIITIHAPLGFLDFDGPGDQKYNNLIRVEQRAKFLGLNIEANSNNLLKLVDFRFFPGSIGNYAGKERKIPTYTVELPSSDPAMAYDYWSELRFALLKAISFKVYDGKDKNPFFRDENLTHYAASTESASINAVDNNTETEKSNVGMISMNLKNRKHFLILSGPLICIVIFQLLIIQRKRSIKKRLHADNNSIESDDTGNVEKVHVLRDDSMMPRYLSKEECEQLINSCEPPLKSIVITALNTGMKKIELLNLKWENVDIDHGCIVLDKEGKSERMIPINDILKYTLINISRRQDVPYVFYNNTTGKPYRNISKSFANARRRSNIKNFHFRDLRHTFASRLIMEGVEINKVMKILGHKSLKTTLKYAHLASSHED
ncbi:MAG: tyrosine-type recombinase/integrase [Nitrospiraceae bacterium]|nr:MAG: tyrosine-type recombinase/integrase [Nitrospiraceae bacterium]